jgi:hypothetical protein
MMEVSSQKLFIAYTGSLVSDKYEKPCILFLLSEKKLLISNSTTKGIGLAGIQQAVRDGQNSHSCFSSHRTILFILFRLEAIKV